jgi:hypothetical protein
MKQFENHQFEKERKAMKNITDTIQGGGAENI